LGSPPGALVKADAEKLWPIIKDSGTRVKSSGASTPSLLHRSRHDCSDDARNLDLRACDGYRTVRTGMIKPGHDSVMLVGGRT
jgi:hypothetical protein